MSGDQGDKWNQACVLLEQGGHDYIPQIEAVRGPSYHSDIGIDDIEFRTGQCDCHTRIRKYLTRQSMFSLVSIYMYNIYQSRLIIFHFFFQFVNCSILVRLRVCYCHLSLVIKLVIIQIGWKLHLKTSFVSHRQFI